MSKDTYTYRLKQFLGYVLGGEIIFCLLIWRIFASFGVFSKQTIGERLMFVDPNYAWFLAVLLPLIIGAFIFQIYLRNKRVNQFKEQKILDSFLAPVSTKSLLVRYVLIRNVLVFGVFALMQPVLGTKTVEGQTKGIELMFVVDISNSMNTRDVQGGETRLTAAKRAMNQIINQSQVSRVGIVIFAGSAYPQMPLSSDLEMAKMYISELNTNLISNQGTNLALALTRASDFFSNDRSKKVLMLVTDGEDHEGGMEEAYAIIKEKNIETLVLGIGTEKGGLVLENDQPRAAPVKDRHGNVVISKVNKSMLEAVAHALGGKVIVSSESFPKLSQFLTQINTSSETNSVSLEFKINENRYQWPLVISLLSLITLFIWESIPNKKREG